MTTILEGIIANVPSGMSVLQSPGTLMYKKNPNPHNYSLSDAKAVDVSIACLGLSPLLESEEGDAIASTAVGDRPDIGLPEHQLEFLRELCKRTRVVLVITSGSAVALPKDVLEAVEAVLYVWYPGQEGGNAVADVLFGRYNPAGRLPVTVPKSLKQVPAFTNYSMRGRTYRFMKQEPLFHFGYGLSYTEFAYSNLRISRRKVKVGESLTVSVDVKNIGKRAGDEVVQMYVSDTEASVPVPLLHLEGFERIHLKPRQRKRVRFLLKPQQLAAYDNEGKPFVEPGWFAISVGGGQPHDKASRSLTAKLRVVK